MTSAAGSLMGVRGSAVEAVSGLVGSNGRPLPASANYLATQQEINRRKELEKGWKHYIGELTRIFPRETGQHDVNVLSNRCATIVDTGVDFLFGKPVTLEVLQDGKPNKVAQAALDGCWGNERKRQTLYAKLGQNGGVFGHVFAKMVPPDKPSRPYCRVVPVDPMQVSVSTDQDDVDTVQCYTIEWSTPSMTTVGQAEGRRQTIERVDPDDATEHENNNDAASYDTDATWLITNWYKAPGTTSSWQPMGEPEVWPHQWAPVVDWQNLPLANQHWGMSDIPSNVQHLNDVLNFVQSNINKIGKHHGSPWPWVKGVSPTDKIDISTGNLIQFHSQDAELNALEAHGDIAGLMNFSADVRSDMDEQTRVPGVATGRLRDVPRVTSGVAFQMMYGPLLYKTGHKQNTYGDGLCDLSLRMLSLCGYGDGTGLDGWEVVVHWPSALPTDDASIAQLALAAKQVGMSQHFIVAQVFAQDYDTEMQYRKDEAKDELRAALQGQAMMPVRQPPGLAAPGNPAGEPGQAPPAQPGAQNTPPVNDPAAVAARQAAKAAGAAMKAAG